MSPVKAARVGDPYARAEEARFREGGNAVRRPLRRCRRGGNCGVCGIGTIILLLFELFGKKAVRALSRDLPDTSTPRTRPRSNPTSTLETDPASGYVDYFFLLLGCFRRHPPGFK